MRLSEQSLSLFKELYIQEFGIQEELTDEEFERLARQLLGVYTAICGTLDLRSTDTEKLLTTT